MAEAIKFENYWDNGMRKWLQKVIIYDDPIRENVGILNTIKENLIGCDIKSNQRKNLAYVKRKGIQLYEFQINHIVSFIVYENYLIIETMDELPTYLKFISEGEASKAQNRLMFILNGFEIIGCDDERIFDCKPSTKIGINFS